MDESQIEELVNNSASKDSSLAHLKSKNIIVEDGLWEELEREYEEIKEKQNYRISTALKSALPNEDFPEAETLCITSF